MANRKREISGNVAVTQPFEIYTDDEYKRKIDVIFGILDHVVNFVHRFRLVVERQLFTKSFKIRVLYLEEEDKIEARLTMDVFKVDKVISSHKLKLYREELAINDLAFYSSITSMTTSRSSSSYSN